MSNVLNKENIVIVVDTYKDRQTGQEKKVFKTIGELVTMQGNDGQPYQFGRLWGPTGSTEFKVYSQENRQQAVNNAQPQQGGYQQQPQNFDSNVPF